MLVWIVFVLFINLRDIVIEHIPTLQKLRLQLLFFQVKVMPLSAGIMGLQLSRERSVQAFYSLFLVALILGLLYYHWLTQVWIKVSFVLLLRESSNFWDRWDCKLVLPNLARARFEVFHDLSLFLLYPCLLHTAQMPLNVALIHLLHPLFLSSASASCLPINFVDDSLNTHVRRVFLLVLTIYVDGLLRLDLGQISEFWVAFKILHDVMLAVEVFLSHGYHLRVRVCVRVYVDRLWICMIVRVDWLLVLVAVLSILNL